MFETSYPIYPEVVRRLEDIEGTLHCISSNVLTIFRALTEDHEQDDDTVLSLLAVADHISCTAVEISGIRNDVPPTI